MAFVHPLLLGGLLLVGIPVLIHLIMQQKPKRLPFPAFRFLLQRHRTNQRTLRLRHLLLLALRIFLIAAVCLALARPKLFSERLSIGSGQPVAAVLLLDTSYSMEYSHAGRTRLDDAKQRALELLDEMPGGSKVAVFDSAEAGGEWLPTVALARERITGLQLRHANGPVTRQLDQAYRLFTHLEQEQSEEEILPRLLYVFSDRTQEGWDASHAKNLKQPEGIRAVFVDVGVENPADVAIVDLQFPQQPGREVPQQVFGEKDRAVLRATVRATGTECNTELLYRVDKKEAGRQQVVLKAGESRVFPLEIACRDFKAGPHEVEVELRTNDALPFNNTRFATFEIRGGRQVLVLADKPADAELWKRSLELTGRFHCDVWPSDKPGELIPNELLKSYKAVCLFSVAKPDPWWWPKLRNYVENGGGLAVIPGGEELNTANYNEPKTAGQVLPGQFEKIVTTPPDKPVLAWHQPNYQHGLLAPFGPWSRSGKVDFFQPEHFPRAFRYWAVKPYEGQKDVLVKYADKQPALLERDVGEGRVLLFTTTLDVRDPPWNNFLESTSSFYLVLANEVAGYLTGDFHVANFNFLAGQTVPIDLPPAPRFPIYSLQGPGLQGSETSVPRPDGQDKLQLAQAVVPGNFTLLDGEGHVAAGFSLNARPEESQLSRVPVEQIEALLGEGAVLPVGHSTNLSDALQSHWGQPVELYPWLMIVVLLVLVLESFLANRFYRRPTPEQAANLAGSPGRATEGEKELAAQGR